MSLIVSVQSKSTGPSTRACIACPPRPKRTLAQLAINIQWFYLYIPEIRILLQLTAYVFADFS